MISSISVENVRLFDGSGWNFPIHPLEVFCGTNSAGKSTLLKVLLLLRQSALVPESYEGTQGRLRFVSSQADLGNYFSFVSHNDGTKDIKIEITIEDVIRESAVNSLIAMKKETPAVRGSRQTAWKPYSLKSSFVFGLEKKESQVSARPQGFLKEARFDLAYSGEQLLTWRIVSSLGKSSEEKNVERYELLVPPYFAKAAMGQLDSLGVERETKFVRYQAALNGILPEGLRSQWGKKGKRSKGTENLFWPLPPQLYFLQTDLQQALRNIHYLGPLRTPAQRYYVAKYDDSPDLDSTGEFLPSILHQRGDDKIKGVPSLKPLDDKNLDTLVEGLNYWLHYLRTGEKEKTSEPQLEIELSTTKDVIVELLLKSPAGSEAHALADSGFGYSQILPILVRGLLAEPRSTLIIEQPELHLNPALQVRLAGFFIELIKAGKQVLIETHSEHLVNAIRVLAAEDLSGDVAKQVGIIFMEMSPEGPKVHRLDIQSDGTVPDWPASFFGEAISLSTRLLKAQGRFMQKSGVKSI